MTLSITPKTTQTEKQHKLAAAAAACTPIKPKTQQTSTSVPSIECHVNPLYDYVTKQQKTQLMSTSVPSMKCHINPSYDYISRQPNQKPTNQYNSDYETIDLIECECKCSK